MLGGVRNVFALVNVTCRSKAPPGALRIEKARTQMRKTAMTLMSGTIAAGLLIVPGVGAEASSTYTNCSQMNQGRYPHGVGKSGAVDRTSGKRVTTFKVDTTLYRKYSTSASKGGLRDLDRDNDGIACERA